MLWKVIQNKISGWKNPENLFSIRNIHYAWLLKAKNRLFNPGQNFCPGQFKYCPGQKIFCPSRWTRHYIDMPRPSAWTKNILSWTKFKLSRTKVLSRVKKSIFCLQKSFKMKLPDWKSLENLSSIRNIHIQWLLKVKNGLFNPGQNFCPGQFQYCPGQKIFCLGRWTRH